MSKTQAQIKAEKEAAKAAAGGTTAAAKKDNGKLVFLDWKAKRLLALHPPQAGVMGSFMSDPNKTLSREEAQNHMKFLQSMSIIPGIHPYPLSMWDECKSNDQVKLLLNKKELEVLTNSKLGLPGDPDTPAQALPESLAELAFTTALQLVEGEVFDNERLAQWAKSLVEREEHEAETLRKQIDLQVRKNTEAAKAIAGA